MTVKTLFKVAVTASILTVLSSLATTAAAQTRKRETKQLGTKQSTTGETILKEPITLKGLLDSFRIGGLPSKELVQTIKARGVAFAMTPEIESELRAAGAKSLVIDAARSNYRPVVGTLNVTATVSGAMMNITGMGRYSDRINALKLPPGHYTVSGEKLGYRPDSKEVEIKFTETTNVELRLEPMTTNELLKLAREYYDRNDYSVAMSLLRTILANQSEHPGANALAGLSLYSRGESEASIAHLVKAITLGESITFPVKHRHGTGFGGKSLCSGRLTLTRDSFEFYSSDFPDEGFKVSYSKIQKRNIESEMSLYTKVRILKANGKEDSKDYNFYSLDATSLGPRIECPQCLPRMRAILRLLTR
jgi:hypothetical protein